MVFPSYKDKNGGERNTKISEKTWSLIDQLKIEGIKMHRNAIEMRKNE